VTKLLIAFEIFVGAAIIAGIVHHWEKPVNVFQIDCQTDRGHTVCLAHNDVSGR
jgi:hypothetical protein